MPKRFRKVVRMAAAGLAATLFQTLGPCSSLQFPPDNTRCVLGVCVALPKVALTEPAPAGLEPVDTPRAVQDVDRFFE